MMESDANIDTLYREIDQRICFIEKYLQLGESHMVDFFVANHWDNFVHPKCQEELMKIEEEYFCSRNVFDFQDGLSQEDEYEETTHLVQNLKQYFTNATNCNIANSMFCISIADFIKDIDKRETHAEEIDDVKLVSTKEYMCNKKSHEVEEMSKLIGAMCRTFEISDVIDFGSGKGYLSTYLSLRYGLNVVGVDCSETNSAGANTRAQKYLKYWNAYLGKREENQKQALQFKSVTAYVDANSDITSFLQSDQREVLQSPAILTGLHTCGNLCSTSLQTFINIKDLKAMCVVGCCYHHLTEDGFPMSSYLQGKNFSLGRNTRMLGLRAPEKLQATEFAEIEAKSTRSLFYRAVFSVILNTEFQLNSSEKDFRVGKIYSKSNGFTDYVKKCLKKLGLHTNDNLSDEKIRSYLHSFQKYKKTLLAYNMLREAFAPTVEALILLDKLLYLKEQSDETNGMQSYLVRIFDPVKSPRCYALIAVR